MALETPKGATTWLSEHGQELRQEKSSPSHCIYREKDTLTHQSRAADRIIKPLLDRYITARQTDNRSILCPGRTNQAINLIIYKGKTLNTQRHALNAH
jgi:hypothetical protein